MSFDAHLPRKSSFLSVKFVQVVKKIFVSLHTNGGRALLCPSPLHKIASVNIFMRRKKEMRWFRTCSHLTGRYGGRSENWVERKLEGLFDRASSS